MLKDLSVDQKKEMKKLSKKLEITLNHTKNRKTPG